MIELPGWNDLISVNGFCYSSSMGESPKLNIPLKTSVAPTKGIAPATFARNSTATYIDKDGILQTAGIGVIRFQNGRYLCESAATNLLKYSELLTNVYWGPISLSIAADVPTGMFKLTNAVTGSCYTKSGDLAYTEGIYYTQSAELMKGNTDFVSMTLASAINSLLPYAIFNLATGIVTKAQDCTATMYPLVSGAYRCTITGVANATVSTLGGMITPCREDSLRVKGVVNDYIYANKIQIETGTKATSYIPTTTSPVTRAADVLHYAVGDVITQGQGSLYCEFWGGNYAGSVRRILNISDGTNSNRLYPYLKDTGGGVAVIGVTAGSTVINVGTRPVSSTLNKLMLSYKDNSVMLYLNGVLVGSDTSCTIPTNFTTLSAGCTHDGALQLNTEIGNIKYFKEVLTPAEAIKLTNLNIFIFSVIDTQTISGLISTKDGTSVTVDWGDGTSNTYSGTDQAYSKNYGSVGNRTVAFTSGSGNLTKFTMSQAGANISFDLSQLPRSLTSFFCSGSNTITGNLSSLPTGLTYFLCQGSNTITGNLSSMPAGLTTFYCGGSNTVIGNLSSLPAGLTYFYCGDSNTITGNLSSMPAGLTTFYCGGSNTITGNLSSLPAGLDTFFCSGSNTITGDLSSLPAGLTYFICLGSNTITGNLSSLPSLLTYFNCVGSNTITGNLSSLPVGLTYFSCSGSNTIGDYSGKAWANNQIRIYFVPVAGGGLSSAEIDQLLIDLAAAGGTWSGNKQVYLTGTNAARTSASDAAVAALVSKGVTVTTTT